MAITFLEPGGDATFTQGSTTAGGFWSFTALTTVVTDFVHGKHVKSLKFIGGSDPQTPTGILNDTGARLSYYMYINALPASTTTTLNSFATGGGSTSFKLRIDVNGVLILTDSGNTQLGSNGDTLRTGSWNRISVAYTISSASVNTIKVFLNGRLSILVTNVTLANIGTSSIVFGDGIGDSSFDRRISDIYVDLDSSLTDTGNIWVTAKRPNANGTTNGFTTQVGSGGSGYGTGHSPQVNERPLSVTNGWSMVGAGSAITEEYNIEGKSVGDIDISTSLIIGYIGWVYTSSLAGETINIILNGVNFSQAITSTNTMYTKVAGSAVYPAGTGTDIGIQTDTSLTTVSLYECGVLVAYIPPPYVNDMLAMFQ